MKNSARYQQLWNKKLEELPVNLDANTAWSEMEHLLNQQMPFSNPANPSAAGKSLAGKTVASKITALLVYIVPITVMISAGAYLFIKNEGAKPKVINIQKTKKQQQNSIQTINQTVIPLGQDTLTLNQSESYRIVNDELSVDTTVLASSTASVPAASSINLAQRVIPGTFKSPEQRPIASPFQQNTGLIPEIPIDKSKADLTSVRDSLIKNESTGISDQLPLRPEVSVDTAVSKSKIERRKSKTRKIKSAKVKKDAEAGRLQFGYGLRSGLNANAAAGLYLGAFGALKSSDRVEIQAGIQLNAARTITGKYDHASFAAPDSLPGFTVTNSRKLTTMDIPVNIRFKLNNKWSLSAGPLVSLPIKKSPALVDTTAMIVDTLNAGSEFVKAIQNTTINKVNFGFRTGISYHLNKIDIDLNYQWLSPYKLNNEIEKKKVRYNFWQVGITYRIR